jgi:hypothetical protein
MILVISDDDAYLRWIEANPAGFVLNARNPPSPDYLMLHRASCRDISSPTRSNRTTTGYMKVCSNDVAELDAWCSKTTGGQTTPCKRCKRLGE